MVTESSGGASEGLQGSSSTTTSMIPVVDLSSDNLIRGTQPWASACNDVNEAMEQYGCFKAIFHGAGGDNSSSTQLHHDIFAAAEELFSLPTETKQKNTSCKPYFDYFGQSPVFPLNESLAVDHPTSSLATQSFADLMWPAGNVSFCESTVSFSSVMAELDKTVMRMICESYGVDGGHYEYYLQATNYVLRFYRYTVPKSGESNVGLGSHADMSMISILRQSVKGLQIKAKNGGWVEVEMSPSSFLVMAGDALTAWSNGRIKSCSHQVIMTEKETRYSVGLSSVINGVVHIPKELGYYDGKLQGESTKPFCYKAFDHFGLLEFIRSGKAKNYDSAIQDYCGVL